MRLIDADKLLENEAEAYRQSQIGVEDKIQLLINEAVHVKVQKIVKAAATVDGETAREKTTIDEIAELLDLAEAREWLTEEFIKDSGNMAVRVLLGIIGSVYRNRR